MNVIEYLKTLEPKQNVTIWLDEQIIADTTADVLLKLSKEGFRKLSVDSVAYGFDTLNIIVENTKKEVR